jgi:hypothetical protein
MKPTLSVICAITALLIGACFNMLPAQSSAEVLEKAITFHDPQQVWDHFSGMMHLNTVFADGRHSGGENIEFRNNENLYRCTRLSEHTTFGTVDGRCYRVIDGQENPDSELIAKKGTDDAFIRRMESWHRFHFSPLAELVASGLKLQDGVETVDFMGSAALALRFNDDGSMPVDSFYKNSDWTVYLDPADYSLRGFRETVLVKGYAVFSGMLELGGMKIPLSRTYFNIDHSFEMSDVFSFVNLPEP